MSTTIEIALASDAKYYCGLLVTAASIAFFANPAACLSFHILDGGLSNKEFEEFVSKISKFHPKVSFTRHILSSVNLDNLPPYADSKMPYARLLLPTLLPNCHYVVYSDIDILWLADIAQTWSLCSQDSVLLSSPETCKGTLQQEEKWFREHGLHFVLERYFCSGFSIFNLDLFRKDDLSRKLFAFLKDNGHTHCADQTALNAILGTRAHLLPNTWQIFPRNGISESTIVSQCLLHYAGEAPWKATKQTHMLTDSQLLWFRFDSFVHKCSLWHSLRRHYSVPQIVMGRFLFFVISSKLGQFFFHYFMRRTGRGNFNESLSAQTVNKYLKRIENAS